MLGIGLGLSIPLGRSEGVGAFGEVFFAGSMIPLTYNAYTAVVHIKAASLIRTPAVASHQAKVTMRGPCRNVFIGHRAASGNVYDFATTPVPVLFSGDPVLAQTRDVATKSDAAAFSWDGVSDILIAFQILNGAIGSYQDGVTTAESYLKQNATEPSLVDKTSYLLQAGLVYMVEALDLYGFSASDAAPNYSALKVVSDGNSLTSGSGVVAFSNYPSTLNRLLSHGATFANLGVSSQTSADRHAANATEAQFVPGAVAVLWEITNSLYFGASAATALSDYVAWCEDVRAQGYKVVAATVLPRSDVGTPGTFETDRQTVNTYLRANWATFSDVLADVAASATIGDAGDETNATYYGDLVHLTAAGYRIVAPIFSAAVLSVL